MIDVKMVADQYEKLLEERDAKCAQIYKNKRTIAEGLIASIKTMDTNSPEQRDKANRWLGMLTALAIEYFDFDLQDAQNLLNKFDFPVECKKNGGVCKHEHECIWRKLCTFEED